MPVTPEVFQVVKMISNAFQVAAVSSARIAPVIFLEHTFTVVIDGCSVCKPVRHQQVNARQRRQTPSWSCRLLKQGIFMGQAGLPAGECRCDVPGVAMPMSRLTNR